MESETINEGGGREREREERVGESVESILSAVLMARYRRAHFLIERNPRTLNSHTLHLAEC